MGVTWSLFFPPSPRLTERNLPRQDGKLFIITGGASGVGYELCTILYQAGGKVYMAGRSETNAQSAISAIKAPPSTSPGTLEFLPIALDDFSTIKLAVDKFMASESRLDVLFNNAGVSNPPKGSCGAQGQELQLATNCIGPYLFTQLLVSILSETAKTTTKGAVRVVWTSSIATDLVIEDGGKYILPWGRLHPSPRKDLLDAMKTKEEGGTGFAVLFMEYCDQQIARFRDNVS